MDLRRENDMTESTLGTKKDSVFSNSKQSKMAKSLKNKFEKM